VPINQLREAARVAYIAGKRLHQDWKPDLPLHDHVESDLIQVRAIVSRIALLDMNDALFGRLIRARLEVVIALEREGGQIKPPSDKSKSSQNKCLHRLTNRNVALLEAEGEPVTDLQFLGLPCH